MINTYDVDMNLEKTMKENLSVGELKQRYADMASFASTTLAYTQAFEQSMFDLIKENILTPEQVEAVSDHANALLDEYCFRNTTEDCREFLKAYGYKGPVVPIEMPDVEFCLNEDIPVLLLFPDDTERLAKDGVDVKRHISSGGIVGISQYSFEKMECIKEYTREE